jgi:CyaY protein
MVSESEFRKLASAELDAIARALDPVPELSVDLANETVTIEFDDGDRFVLNEQGPSRQLWFAASFAAAHFDWDGANWKDSKTGETLRTRVARDIGQKLGRPVSI